MLNALHISISVSNCFLVTSVYGITCVGHKEKGINPISVSAGENGVFIIIIITSVIGS